MFSCYFGAIFNKYTAIMAYNTSGMSGASIGLSVPLVVKALKTFISRINENANPIPIARLSPVPPLVFLHERVTPIMVSIMYAKGLNNR